MEICIDSNLKSLESLGSKDHLQLDFFPICGYCSISCWVIYKVALTRTFLGMEKFQFRHNLLVTAIGLKPYGMTHNLENEEWLFGKFLKQSLIVDVQCILYKPCCKKDHISVW